MLILLQFRYELSKKSLLIIVQISAAIVVSVRDTNTTAISLYCKNGCGAAERLNISKNSATANAEFCHEIGDGFLSSI